MARGLELTIRGNNRSAIRALKEVADQSAKTGKQVQHDSKTASSGFDEMGRHAHLLRGAVSGLAGAVGFGGLAFGIADAVKGGLQLQASQAQLQAALKATGQTAKGTDGQLFDYAKKLSTSGGFATTQNLAALTAFVRETHNAARAQQGLALATNIARGRGMDLASAQMIVQRAYGGSIGRLQALLGPMVAAKDAQFGLTQAHAAQIVALENQAKAMGKGSVEWLRYQKLLDTITPKQRALAVLQDKQATAQQVIQAAQTVFGGATGAYSRTTQGKITDLQDSMKNLTEELGLKLLPIVNQLVKGATAVVGWFGKLPDPVKLAVAGFTLLVPLLAFARTGFGLLGGIVRGMGSLITNPFGTFRTALLGAAGTQEKAAAGPVGPLNMLADAAERAAIALGGVAGEGGAGAAAAAGGAASGAEGAAAAKADSLGSKLGRFARGASRLILPAYLGYQAYKLLAPGDKFSLPVHETLPTANMGAGALRRAGGAYSLHRAMGGPIGTDTVPLWATPGEGVVSPQGMARIGGEQGLAAINTGAGYGGQQPLVIHSPVYLDGRKITDAVTRVVLNRAARGPTSLVGGSLVSGSSGLPVSSNVGGGVF